MGKPNKALIAAAVLLGKPGLTEAELVKSATDSLAGQVNTLQATINAESAIVASAQKSFGAEVQRLQGEFQENTKAPSAKIAGAKLASNGLMEIYNQLIKK